MKKKLTLHRDTLLNLDSVDGVQGGVLTNINTLCAGACPTQIYSCTGTCFSPCTISIQPTKFIC